MKTSALTPGTYFDGKKGLRKIVRREGDRVIFQKLVPAPGIPFPIDMLHECSVADFGKWAKVRLDQPELSEVSMALSVRAVSLNEVQEQALRAAAQGERVLGKVRTSLLEKGLILVPSPQTGISAPTELGTLVLNRLDTAPEKSA